MASHHPQQQHRRPHVLTREEALNHLGERFAAQLERATEDRVAPNEPAEGDGATKARFWELLYPQDQRAFFLTLVKNRRMWPRLRTLVGAPPYSFLRDEDEGILRAGGISKHRVRMACAFGASAYSDFHSGGHFEDCADRLYRVIERYPRTSDVPWANVGKGTRLVLDVRIRKRSQREKLELLSSGPVKAASVLFPRIGDRVKLMVVPKLLSPESIPLTVSVVSGKQKCPQSPIARLGVQVC